MTTSKTDILFMLGERPAKAKVWPNYLEYGFDQSDVPELLKLVADKNLHSALGDSKDVWVPLHAWRTLGQLKCTDAAVPLINLFDDLVKDDWAMSELPEVMGMIGEVAIAPLVAYMNDTRHEEFARVMAIHGLCEVASHHPALRDAVLRGYKSYLAQPDTSVPSLNGLLVSYLLDLNARELIGDIRALFDQGCVDISCAGDLEAIEIELGFRTERSTPRSPPFDMFGIGPMPRPEGDDVFELLDYYLDRYGNDESILDVSELDGFFAALACCPRTIMPSRWMPAIWGGEEHSPEWHSKKELEGFGNLIFLVYNSVMERMNQGDYKALFLIRELEGKSHTIVDEWCSGFLRGINLWGPIPSADAVIVTNTLEPIRLFATEQGFEKLETMTEEEVGRQQDAIAPNVRTLFQHFFTQRRREHEPVIHATPKVGRNDPCPCGSGKKYKKCCLH